MNELLQSILEGISSTLTDLGINVAKAIFSFLYASCNVILGLIFSIPNMMLDGLLDDLAVGKT